MRESVTILAAMLAGCYHYVGPNVATPKEGSDVRVEFVSPRDVMLQDVTVHGIRVLQGRLFYATADSVVLAATRLWGVEGRTYEATRVGVSLPRTDIAGLRTKRLAPAQTGLAIAAGGAGIVAMILGVGELVGSGGEQRPKPQP